MNKFKKGFTLVEALIVAVIVSMIFMIVISLYFEMMKTKVSLSARQSLMENSYYMFERLNVLIKDYDIDYEEYFNRRIVGCDNSKAPNFSWDVGHNGYCDTFSSYGNKRWDGDNKWELYYCSSEPGASQETNEVVNSSADIDNGKGCWNDKTSHNTSFYQSFGQYEQQFWNRKEDTDGTGGVVNDDDDIDLGKGPLSIANNTGVQELYLISDDNKERLFIRRNYVGSGDWDNNGTKADSDIDKLYTLQMMKLRGFDAGKKHDITKDVSSDNNKGLYDGQIDTWACDYGKGYNCGGSSLGGPYSDYNLPQDKNDGWTNIFGKDITITDWNIKIHPTKNSDFAWVEDSMQMNPYISIQMKTKLYGEPWSWKINPEILDNYQLDLQTTFNIRNNY